MSIVILPEVGEHMAFLGIKENKEWRRTWSEQEKKAIRTRYDVY